MIGTLSSAGSGSLSTPGGDTMVLEVVSLENLNACSTSSMLEGLESRASWEIADSQAIS